MYKQVQSKTLAWERVATDASGAQGDKIHTFQRSFGINTARCSLRRRLDADDRTEETDSASGEQVDTGDAGKDCESNEAFLDELSDGVDAIADDINELV